MRIDLDRFYHDDNATLGLVYVDEIFQCFSLEDEPRPNKVAGETRIPAGEYEIALRNDGPMNDRYAQKFPWHKGMLWLLGVPDFTYIYIHIGNHEDHTDGCLLVGQNCTTYPDPFVGRSTAAYEALYRKVAGANHLTIRIRDEIRGSET